MINIGVEKPSILQGTSTSHPKRQLHVVFEELLASGGDIPNDVAIWDGPDGTLTFAQLNVQANILARVLAKTLADHGARVRSSQEALVGIMMAPSSGRIAAVLACFKLGLAYVPLDQAMSDQRIRDIWVATRPLCLIVGEQFGWRSQNLVAHVGGSGLCLVYFEHLLSAALLRKTSEENLQPEERVFNTEDPIALVIYTSGSTGKPKGVPLTHSNVLNRLQWQWNALPFHCGEIVAHKTSFLFIDSVSEVFASLLKGVPLVVVAPETLKDVPAFLRLLQHQYVTRLVVIPSLLQAMLLMRQSMTAEEAELTSLHTVVCSGEPLLPRLARAFFEVFPTGKRLVNLYGSTEVGGDATVQSFYCEEDVDRLTYRDCISVGAPLDNTDIYLVGLDDRSSQVVEEGIQGEVCVSGLCVSSGYWQSEPALLGPPRPRAIISPSAPFVDNLIRPRRGFLQMHCTGDIGVLHAGHLYLQGRKDSQIKVRGHRVNAWEIDSVVKQHSSVKQSITIAVKTGDSTCLVCFFTRRPEATLHTSELQERTLPKLPSYIRPVFIELGRLPLQPQTGKIDRESLRRMYLQLSHRDAGPTDTLEDNGRQEMRAVIAKSLGLAASKVRDSDDFFKLGGDSLSAVLCVARLREAGRSIDVETFTSAGTIGDLLTMLQRDVYVRQSSEREDLTAESFSISVMEEDDDDVSYFLAQIFAQKEVLSVISKTAYEDLAQWLEDNRMIAVRDRASLVIRRKKDGRLMGATLAFDHQHVPNVIGSQALDIVGAFLEACVDPSVEPNDEECWLTLMMLATADEDLSGRQRLQLVEMLENETIKRAKELGYAAIETINTNRVTTKISEELGYRLVKSIFFHDFEYGMDLPFENVDDNEKACTMLLPL